MGKNCNNTGKFKKIQQPLHLYNIKTKTMELCMMELIFNRKWPIAAKPRNLLKSTCMRNVHDIMLFLHQQLFSFTFSILLALEIYIICIIIIKKKKKQLMTSVQNFHMINN